MSSTPQVTVVVPVYNVQAYLSQCIESLVNQTLDDIEIVLVDDGSSDDCPAICDNYASEIDHIRVIHQQNGGLSAARNTGVRVASGEYIAFVDSDDYVAPNMFHMLYTLARVYSADIVKAAHYRIDESGMKVVRNACRTSRYCISGGMHGLYYRYYHALNVNVWDGIYHRTIFRSVSFPAGYVHEDHFFTPKAVYAANKICLVDEPLYFHRVMRHGSITATFSSKKLDLLRAFIDTEQFLSEKGCRNLHAIRRSRQAGSAIRRMAKTAAQTFEYDDYRTFVKQLMEIYSKRRILIMLLSLKPSSLLGRLELLLLVIDDRMLRIWARMSEEPKALRKFLLAVGQG